MAAIRSGFLGAPSLEECRSTPEVGKFWGVEEPASVVVRDRETGKREKKERPIARFLIGETTFDLYRHPALLIDEDVFAHAQEAEYIGESSPIKYSETNPAFHIARKLYERYFQQFREAARPKGQKVLASKR